MPRLTLPAARFRESYLAAAAEFAAEERPLVSYLEVNAETFTRALARMEDYRLGRDLPPEYVPATTLWLVEGSEFLGQVSIRPVLNPWLAQFGGHIGYLIRPTARLRGYGRQILRLALPEAHRLGIDPALLTCDATNWGSRKIIEANGGVLENQVEQGGDLPPKLRFWVPTG